MKFTDDGGTISFTVTYHAGMDTCYAGLDTYHAGLDREQIMVHYRIADTGVGMSPEFLKKIFDEFSQEESGARTHYKGTGLGMAITKRYVDLLGGTISVESEKGVGTTFTVDIPMKKTNEIPKKETLITKKPKNLTGVKVLMAEDNDLNAELATVILEEAGMKVTRVENGKRAVETWQSHPAGTYDVILMDIMMPVMDGYAATRAIRALPRKDAKTIPIIAMTANAFAEDIEKALDAGMNAHLSKPIVIEDVLHTISNTIG